MQSKVPGQPLMGVVGIRIISQCIAPHSAHCRARITASAVKQYPAGVPPMGSWPLSQGRLAAAKAPVRRGADRRRS